MSNQICCCSSLIRPFCFLILLVAPTLFLALSTIPQVSQVSFLGLDGLFFSYYYEGDQTRAIYSDTSLSSKWYIQPVNRDTGKLYGEPVITSAKFSADKSWMQEALNKTIVYSYLGVGYDKAQTLLFKNMVRMDGRGLIKVGFPARVVGDQFSHLEFQDGDFHLASDDGQVLVHTKLPDTQIVVRNGSVTMRSTKPNGWDTGFHSCRPEDGDSRKFRVTIRGIRHTVYCSTLQIAGLHSVYTMAFPAKEWDNLIYENSKLSLTLLILMFVIVVIALCIYVILILKAAKREMILWAARVKQLECTQQAECKSMNKSLAFAKATHDIRNSLTAIADLIDICQKDVAPNSEVSRKITQIKTCTKDLIELLDTVLDTRKIEAGKVQLENKEFDLQQLLEDVIDMYYPIGKSKGVDVILDPCDGSIFKSRLVKGDRGKLKQILCNLLCNAVKFTPKGHVTVRGIVKKTSKCSSNTSGLFKCLFKCFKNNEGFNDLDDLRKVQENPNYMEFEFDVDDTGEGIAKDRRKDVFLYYVQVKETALGQGGCGLGLGIVQSLVRLMGGEIKIVDKEPHAGTCFRFNIILMVCDPVSCTGIEGQETYVHNDAQSHDFHPHFGLHIPFPASRSDGSHVVLHVSGEERGKILKKFIESQGVKVSNVKQTTEFSHVLDKTILKLNGLSSLDGTEMISEYLNNSASRNSNSGPHDDSSGSNDAGDHPLSNYKSSISRGSSSFILIVIDADAITVPILELCSVIANFRRKIHDSSCCCKVVWLDIPITRDAKLKLEPDEDNPTCSDIILSRPFHGSRLYDVLGLLPEFKVTYHNTSPKIGSQTTHGVLLHSKVPNTTNDLITSSPRENHHLEKIVIHECDEQSSAEKPPLSGKKILVVEDGEVLRKVATTKISKLGALVDTSENGQEAFDQVCQVLSKQRMEEGWSSKSLPYDYIIMDCEMPVVDGYEATRRIRLEEKKYGVYIPIIALTASTEEAIRKTKDAGMDFHLTKPLQVDKLLDAIRDIESSKETHS